MPTVVRSTSHNKGVQAARTETSIVVVPSNCIAGHFSAVFADWTEYHIHRVINGVMIRLPITKGAGGLSSNHDSRISNGADTTNQRITLAMARKRHDRTGLLDGFCPVDGCDPAVDAFASVVVGLILFNSATGREHDSRVYACSATLGSCDLRCVN